MTGSLSILFNNGIRCPLMGFGTWNLRGEHAYKSVKYAIELGYKHIDTAYWYQNEEEVGQAINKKIADGQIKRDDIFVVSKLSSANHKQDIVVPAIRKSLENLKLEYLDLYLIHFPWATIPITHGQVCLQSKTTMDGKNLEDDIDPTETWRGMEECVKLGLVRSIGISNFNSKQTDSILESCTIKPVTNQVELHHLLNQEELRKFSEERDIKLTAYRSLGGVENIDKLVGDPRIRDLAKKCGRTPAQIILRWITQRGIVVLPKSARPSQIKENFMALDFEMSDEDMKYVMSLNRNTRFTKFLHSKDFKHYPFKDELNI